MAASKSTGGMKIQVHLPTEVGQRLEKVVEARGTTVSRYGREAIEEKLQREPDEFAKAIGAAVGAAIGAMFGGPAGAMIGAGLGAAASDSPDGKKKQPRGGTTGENEG